MKILDAGKDVLSNLVIWGTKHRSALLGAVTVGGTVGAVYSGIAVTPEATRRIDNEQAERIRLGYPSMTLWEKLRMVGPLYIPCGLFLLLSTGSAIWNICASDREYAALLSAYSIIQKDYGEYRAKTRELVGEKKERRIRDEIVQDHVNVRPTTTTMVIGTGNGEYLWFDDWSGQYFRATIQHVRQSHLYLREQLCDSIGEFLTLNEIYEELGIKFPEGSDGYKKLTANGERLGFNSQDKFEFIESAIRSPEGEPGLGLKFYPDPHENYLRNSY